MTMKERWALVGFVAFAAAMIGLLIYGVRTHEEADLLRGCVRADGSFDYVGDCTEVVWQKPMPLKTHVVGGSPWQHEMFYEAVESLEAELGLDILEQLAASQSAQADVIADFDVPFEQGGFNPAGRVRHVADLTTSKVVVCTVYLSNLALEDIAHAVVRHELGHVLGLAHDANASSLMTDKSLEGGRTYLLSDQDRARLRSLYASK